MVTVYSDALKCGHIVVQITYWKLDDLVKHDVRRDVEIKDKILQSKKKSFLINTQLLMPLFF